VLTESQLQALAKAKEEREAQGEIETRHPGYLCAQDTYYVGHVKGTGKIYQQTFIDTYSRLAFAKAYTEKNRLIATDMLNDKVIPFFDNEQVAVFTNSDGYVNTSKLVQDSGRKLCCWF
jgi:hypothetical protein